MNFDALFEDQFDEHVAVLARARAGLRDPFLRLVEVCASASRAGGTIVFFGNGGSAADAQHLATELTVRYAGDRTPIAGLALTTDSSALTAIGNDFGFVRLFARQVEALCRRGDVCIGISTSGRSENVAQGLVAARDRGCVAAGLLGGDGGYIAALCDPVLIVPSTTTARIQEIHILLGHMLCAALERALGLQ